MPGLLFAFRRHGVCISTGGGWSGRLGPPFRSFDLAVVKHLGVNLKATGVTLDSVEACVVATVATTNFHVYLLGIAGVEVNVMCEVSSREKNAIRAEVVCMGSNPQHCETRQQSPTVSSGATQRRAYDPGGGVHRI